MTHKVFNIFMDGEVLLEDLYLLFHVLLLNITSEIDTMNTSILLLPRLSELPENKLVTS